MAKLNMSRDALRGTVSKAKASKPEPKKADRKPQPKKDEVVVLNDYEVFAQVGPMKLFVDLEWYSKAVIKAGGYTIKLAKVLESNEFTVQGKRFRLGKPSKAYKAFLKGDSYLDLEERVVYDCSIFDLEKMQKRPLVDSALLRDQSHGLALIGKCFNHDSLPDGKTIVVGNISKTIRVSKGGAEILSVMTVDGVQYLVLDKVSDDILGNVNKDCVFADPDDDQDEADD